MQRRLERVPSRPTAAEALLARAWGSFARVERPLTARAPALCVGGATLGGSGKTPLAIACARFLAEEGRRVALVSHAYRASPPRAPRVVAPDDDVAIVGDEALECARALGPLAKVLVARRRQDALDEAANADVVVLDGPLQLAPKRATLSLLALDPAEPWGSGECPPAGNLRAPRAALLAAADRVVASRGESRGAWHGGELLTYERLATLRVGLVTGVARPHRVVDFLRARGVVPIASIAHADHARFEQPAAEVDLWLTTAKDAARIDGPAAVIDYHLDLPPSLRNELTSRFPFRF